MHPAPLLAIENVLGASRPEMAPQHSMTSNLVYSASCDVVDSVVCAGRVC